MALALCPATLLAWSPTIVGGSPLTSEFCNSARTPKSRMYHQTSVPLWRRLHDFGRPHHSTDRPMAAKLAACGYCRSAACHPGVPARPRAVLPLLSFRLSLLDRHGAWMPGHLADASC